MMRHIATEVMGLAGPTSQGPRLGMPGRPAGFCCLPITESRSWLGHWIRVSERDDRGLGSEMPDPAASHWHWLDGSGIVQQ